MNEGCFVIISFFKFYFTIKVFPEEKSILFPVFQQIANLG